MSCPECSTLTLTIVHTHGRVHWLQTRIAELEREAEVASDDHVIALNKVVNEQRVANHTNCAARIAELEEALRDLLPLVDSCAPERSGYVYCHTRELLEKP